MLLNVLGEYFAVGRDVKAKNPQLLNSKIFLNRNLVFVVEKTVALTSLLINPKKVQWAMGYGCIRFQPSNSFIKPELKRIYVAVCKFSF